MPETTLDYDVEAVKPRKRTDHNIWGVYISLLIIAVVELFSASSQEVRADDIYGPILRHARFLGIGLLIMLGLQQVHFKHIYRFIPLFVLFSIVLMVLVLVAGVDVNGARRGLMIGSTMVLPAEFLKLAAALGVAWILSRTQQPGKHDVTWAGVIGSASLVLFCSGLLFSHGLTNTLLLMGISLAMMLVGGVGTRKFLIVLAAYALIGAGAMAYKKHTHEHADIDPVQTEINRLNKVPGDVEAVAGNRFGTWGERLERHFRLNKYADTITDENKQEQLSYIAQARGGWHGVGIGQSRENARLPLAFSDYIYAIIIEECGIIVGIFVLCCYLWLLARAGRLALAFRSTMPCLLVIGCALFIVFQALFHICIVTGVFPVSGQPLPLISKGGFSVIATSIALGIMLSASRHAARKGDEEETIRQEIEALPENLQSSNPSQL